jgi:hypothetical protein
MALAQEAGRFKKLTLDIPTPKVVAFIDEKTKTVLDYFLGGWGGADVQAALRATDRIRDEQIILYSYLDFTGKVFGEDGDADGAASKLPANMSSLTKDVKNLKIKKKFLPMYVAGGNHYLNAFISAFGPAFRYEYHQVKNYEDFLERINASRNDS